MDKNVFRSLSYGVYVIGSLDGERPTGCTANSVMQITSSPATVAVSINHDNYTNGCIARSGYFSCSILSEKSDAGLIGGFGFCSGKDADKFEGVSYKMSAGVPVLLDACGYVVCKVIDTMETSTHTVFLGEVVEGEVLKKEPPMTYAYYHNVIKGKSSKNAPTYLPEEGKEPAGPEKREAQYRCNICGYVHKGESLPEDFKCPICGVSARYFTKEV
ncbi:MAG: flavin reductase [Lachnospiraceae bacterium]|nr:flavin reductase [Lachnospiraceae bacterium]